MVIIPLILLSTLYDRLARGEEKYIFISDLGAILIIPVPVCETEKRRRESLKLSPTVIPTNTEFPEEKATFTER